MRPKQTMHLMDHAMHLYVPVLQGLQGLSGAFRALGTPRTPVRPPDLIWGFFSFLYTLFFSVESGRLNHGSPGDRIKTLWYIQYLHCMYLWPRTTLPLFFRLFVLGFLFRFSKCHTGKMGLFNYLLTG